jgi:hypothetical protein
MELIPLNGCEIGQEVLTQIVNKVNEYKKQGRKWSLVFYWIGNKQESSKLDDAIMNGNDDQLKATHISEKATLLSIMVKKKYSKDPRLNDPIQITIRVIEGKRSEACGTITYPINRSNIARP